MNEICIVGGSPSWVDCPKDKPIWCVSSVYERLRSHGHKPMYVFQLHSEAIFESWIDSLGSSAVLMRPSRLARGATILPAKELVESFGKHFASSITWMIGYALIVGVQHIRIYGVDMMSATEYAQQRDTFFYMQGVARGQGVCITVPKGAGIEMKEVTYEWKE